MIEIRDLRVQYGELVAVDGATFTAEPGVIFGLLGPNGAGKTSTLGCVSGLLSPTAGTIRVFGHDVARDGKAAKRALGVVPQEIALYEELSARENLRYWGGAYGLAGADLERRVTETLERVELADRSKERVARYSGGMKRRLNFACGVVHRPRAILLDEPTVGVDPQSRVKLLDWIREEARAGAAVVYTTHYMEEAEALCDRLAVIDGGRLIAQGTLEELRGLLGERDLLRLAGRFDPARAREVVGALDGVEVVDAGEGLVTLSTAQASRRLSEVFAALATAGSDVRETTLIRPSLESLFIKLTGRELRE